MERYCVSVIIQDNIDKRAWMSSMNDSVLSLDEAFDIISHARRDHTVLSAWVDVYDENNAKHIAFHDCYVDTFGNVDMH